MDRMAEFRLHEGDHVRIRNHVNPELYQGMSTMFNEGVIKKVREDRLGLPQVFIEWDKTHWSYNGAPDGWTFEDHFDIVENMSQDNNQPFQPTKSQLAALTELLNSLANETETSAPPPEPKKDALRQRLDALLAEVAEPQSTSEPDYSVDLTTTNKNADKIAAAQARVMEEIKDAEAFIVISVKREEHPKASDGVMIPHAISFSLNPVAELLASVHMSSLGAQAYQDLVVASLQVALDK